MSSKTKKLKKPKVVTIRRSKWVHGGNRYKVGSTALLQAEPQRAMGSGVARMCCLGFYCKAAGLASNEIRGVLSPRDAGDVPGLSRNGQDLKICSEMIAVNDSTLLDMNVREERLTKLASRLGVKFVFKD